MKAVIVAAGKGLRLRPFTTTIPKPLIPVSGRPLLDHTIKMLDKGGFTEILIVVSARDKLIQERYETVNLGPQVSTIIQKDQKGTADAFSLAEKFCENEAFLGMNGDVVISPQKMKPIVEIIRSLKKDHLIVGVRKDDPSRYGVLDEENGYCREIVEKPQDSISNIINAGIYYFQSSIFDRIRQTSPSKRNELEITDSIHHTIQAGEKVRIHVLSSWWLDIGLPWDLLDANSLLMMEQTPRVRGIVETGAIMKGPVIVGENSVIKSGTYVEGPVIIGSNCTIGPNCYIRASTYLEGDNHIGNGVEIKNSIIMQGTSIGHLSYVGDSILGRKCNFGAGTKVANLRFDEQPVKVKINEKVVSSGKRKLGVFLGDNVKTGINASLMPGIKAGPNSIIGAAICVKKDVEPDTELLD
ncbi:MAG: bifunctional sugar-1-phosphate nucleotidylyltransferase/acetyltransferase [Promethearchaeota archaeon]